MIIALTGHREQRLGLPSDVSSDEWKPIRNWIRQTLIENNATEVISGMAGGSDLAIAYEVCKMKEDKIPIKLKCVFPCQNYGRKSPHYTYIVGKADKVLTLHKDFFKGCDNDRDQYMADHCDIMLAIFDGNRNSGVWSTITKAQRNNKKIIYCPKELLGR